MKQHSKLELIKFALEMHCNDTVEGNYHLSRIERGFYTFKAIVCIILGLKAKQDRPYWYMEGFGYYWEEPIHVAMFDYREYNGAEGTMHDWNELRVGYKFFSDWRCDIEETGYP